MELGFIGLGKMGLNMVTRLLRPGVHRIVVYDKSKDTVAKAVALGAEDADSVEELVSKLTAPRNIWIMVPSGAPVDDTIARLLPLLEKNDCVIDGGNSNYKDSMRRAAALGSKGVRFLDVGTSGGVWGLKEGYCLMVGGEKDVFERLAPVFEGLAPRDGFAHVGPSGAGHYVKMVHNGIEYGMLQAYAEGFALLEASEFKPGLEDVSRLWMRGSVVRSWLLELAVNVFKDDPGLADIQGYVEDSGEGRWTVLDGIEKSVPCPVITLSLMQRFASRQDNPFAARVIAALRNQFGGHKVVKA